MKAKIEKELNIAGHGYYRVFAEDNIIQSFSFDLYQEPQVIWAEDKARAEAMNLAKLIEQSKDGKFPIKEIIYETPEENNSQI